MNRHRSAPFDLLVGLILVGVVFAAVAVAEAQAPYPSENGPVDVRLRFDGDVHVSAVDTTLATVVVNGDAHVEGVVRGGLLVANGRALIEGHVAGPVVVVGGRFELGSSGRVDGDVMLYRSAATLAPGAVVVGEFVEEDGFSLGFGAALFVWLGLTFAALVGGFALVFFFGGRPRPVEAVLEEPKRTALVAAGAVLGVPLLAFMAFMTGVGVLLGFAVLFAVIPLLWVSGYLTSGLAVGHALMDRFRPEQAVSPYAAAALGIGLLQVALLLPVLSVLVPLAGPFGAGALLYAAWMARPQAGPTAETPAAMPAASPS